MTNGYVYLLQPESSIKKGEPVYKIGKTCRENFTRFNEYPKGSALHLYLRCNNCDSMENVLLELFKQQFKQRKDYGREFFEGDSDEMEVILMNEVMQMNKNSTKILENTDNNTTNDIEYNDIILFLNETSKNVMNLKDFINNINVTFGMLFTIGDIGFVKGVTEIFMKQLRELDVSKRPIHCINVRRVIMMVKDDDVWNYEEKGNVRLKHAIEQFENRIASALQQWHNMTSGAMVDNIVHNTLYNIIFAQLQLGDSNTRDKIIEYLAKEVAINPD